ncbi:ABC transporter ATP-binding protein [Roseibium marinum]|uniref:ABC-2 type transport system ATP-binding protein n=1 Tax=Roseibium marinum TaxID=281252 RepID=A0A2S3UJ98_9HYPH|nr:ATP-binding cassette domain-containing protein [Roseibium marinum]POF27792.1 ABC-2 type transport system ATP-binding protein [Roseibium marinum]
MEFAIEVCNVTKTYKIANNRDGNTGWFHSLVKPERKELTAVSDLSFQVSTGDSVGYLGPNGAGKSTMIKMMTGILVPTSGTIELRGRQPHLHRKENAQHIGVVFGQRSQLWWELPVVDSFELHKIMYSLSNYCYERNKNYLLQVLEIKNFWNQSVRQLSLGQRMRAELALALIHEPKILFLDEPTIGLDIEAKEAVRKILRQIQSERELTIILTSHDLQDIREICSKVIIVNGGELIFEGTLDTLRAQMGPERRLVITFAKPTGELRIAGTALISNDKFEKHYLIQDRATSSGNILAQLKDIDNIVDFSVRELTIEEIVKSVYRNGSIVKCS